MVDLTKASVVADTLLAKYAQPVTDGWHRYAVSKSIGWAGGLIFVTLLWIISIVLLVIALKDINKSVKNNEDMSIIQFIISLICLLFIIVWVTYISANCTNIGTAMYYPDAYWLIDVIN